MIRITEKEMMAALIKNLIDLSPVEFIEEYNRQMGTNLILDEVKFGGINVENMIGD